MRICCLTEVALLSDDGAAKRHDSDGLSGIVKSAYLGVLAWGGGHGHASKLDVKGVAATLFGMTWARAAIFYGSDVGKDVCLKQGVAASIASWLPSIFISTFVQVVNQPIVRGTITIQNPASTHPSLGSALVDIYSQRGMAGLWHGTGASVPLWVPRRKS